MAKNNVEFSNVTIDLDSVVSDDLKDAEGKPAKYSDLGVGEFFERVKELRQTMTDKVLVQQLEAAEKLLKKFKITKQKRGAEMLQFYVETFVKERKLLKYGITDYVMCSDVNLFRASAESSRHLVIDILENFEREIPDDIVETLEKCGDIFDQLVILYTDYTPKTSSRLSAGRKSDKKKRDKITMERDPILFGLFGKWTEDGECIYSSPRMYVIGDWVDEKCDLTLSRMVTEFSKLTSSPLELHEVGKPSENLTEDAAALVDSMVKIEVSNGE